jgi:hypothetical protein
VLLAQLVMLEQLVLLDHKAFKAYRAFKVKLDLLAQLEQQVIQDQRVPQAHKDQLVPQVIQDQLVLLGQLELQAQALLDQLVLKVLDSIGKVIGMSAQHIITAT